MEKREGRTWRETVGDIAKERGYSVENAVAEYDKLIEVDRISEESAADQAIDWVSPRGSHGQWANPAFDRPLRDQDDPIFRAFARLAHAYAERTGEDLSGALLHSGAFHELTDGCESQREVSVNVAKLARRLNNIHPTPARYLPPARHIMCQAEDMGGWPACDRPATLRTRETFDGKHRHYCTDHRVNRHVWNADELEEIPQS